MYLLNSGASSAGTTMCEDIEYLCALVVYPGTRETITNYKQLARDPIIKDTWTEYRLWEEIW